MTVFVKELYTNIEKVKTKTGNDTTNMSNNHYAALHPELNELCVTSLNANWMFLIMSQMATVISHMCRPLNQATQYNY